MVVDNKGWDGDPNDDILYGSPGHGLSGVKRYADEFIIETNGMKYAKTTKKKKLVLSKDTNVQQGSKITFIKNFE
jgi:anti-sigma regulatory factor (Ser/Thr protein kinase)